MVVSPPFVIADAAEETPVMVGKGVVVNGIVVFALDNAAKIPLELASILVSLNRLSIVRWVRIRLKSARLSRETHIYGSHVSIQNANSAIKPKKYLWWCYLQKEEKYLKLLQPSVLLATEPS